MRHEYFVRYENLQKVLDASPWCPCRKARRGLFIVRLDEQEVWRVKEIVWRVVR